jgi:DNA topoisomerase I
VTAATAPGPELHEVSPLDPGLTRRRRGRGFSYADVDGSPVDDPEVLARIRSLAVPPAWKDVWICPDPLGHIQAVGTDDAGRRQYCYHDEWRRRRDLVKHERVLTLGQRLHRVREQVRERMQTRGLHRDRVLAAGVRMLDIGVFRSGGEQYAPADDDDDADGSFGLATLRRDHVRLHRGAVLIHYLAKGGIEREVALRDPALHKVVGSLLRRRGGGDDLLAYRNGRGWHDVRAEDLNAAVKELAGEDYTSKDLRTWNATVFAAVQLAAAAAGKGVPPTERGRKRVVSAAVKDVAAHLGNTPTVCRASYIDPRVIDAFADGRTVLPALRRLHVGAAADLVDDDARATIERAVVRLLQD